jgi:hypothetical protein
MSAAEKEQIMQAGRYLGVALACAVGLTTAMAARVGHAQGAVLPQQATVEIVDRAEGRVLPIYWHEGRRYVIGKPGNEYAVRVRNADGGRVLAVMSVDGVNVITGATASPQQSGYVLAPGESTDISGWRKSMSRTAAFYFTALPDSYAARTGRPDNVGVIGVAVYRERVVPIAREEMRPQNAARGESAPAAAPSPPSGASAAADAVAQAPAERLGTGHGRNEASYASYTHFERASNTPSETITIYYDSYENLLAQGVPVASPPLARARPDPFPDAGRFVPDPRTP